MKEAPTMEKISEAKQAIIDTINDKIGLYLSEFGGHGTDKEILGEIKGMIRALEIMTGEHYEPTENGLVKID